MSILKTQLDAQERGEKKGGEVLGGRACQGGGSYVLQRVLCSKSSFEIERTSGPGCGRGEGLRGARAEQGRDPGGLGW